jgi:O-antigen/teichoic acid export membrane protein
MFSLTGASDGPHTVALAAMPRGAQPTSRAAALSFHGSEGHPVEDPARGNTEPTRTGWGAAERRVAINTLWLTAQPLVMNVLSLVPIAYIARTIGASEFGRFQLGLAFVSLFSSITTFGLRPVAVRALARDPRRARPYLGDQLLLRGVLALATAGIVALSAPFSGGGGETGAVIIIAGLTLVPATAVSVLEDGFNAMQLMRPVSVAAFIAGVTLTIASVVVVALGGDIRMLALSYTIGPLVNFFALWFWANRHALRPTFERNWQAFPGMLREASPFFGAGLVDSLVNRLDLLVLARIVGDTALGPYSAATMLVWRASVLAHGASTSLLPAVSELKTHNLEAATRLLRSATTTLLLVTLPAAALVTAMAEPIMAVLFGDQYRDAWPVLATAIWSLPGSCLVIVQMQALYAADRQSLVLWTKTAAALLTVPLLVLLVKAMGLLGGALLYLLRVVLPIALRARGTRAEYQKLWPLREMGWLAVGMLFMTLPLLVAFSHGLSLVGVAAAVLAVAFYLAGVGLTDVIPMREVRKLRVSARP